MATITAAGPAEFLDLVFWTINNKVAATGKCYFGIVEGVGRADGCPENTYRDSVCLFIRDKVSLHDAVMIANLTLDQIADINGLQNLRQEVKFVDEAAAMSERAE